MSGYLSVVVKSSRLHEQRRSVGRFCIVGGFAFGRTEGDLVATGGSGRSGLRHNFRKDVWDTSTKLYTALKKNARSKYSCQKDGGKRLRLESPSR
jgi:hypothetical protein